MNEPSNLAAALSGDGVSVLSPNDEDRFDALEDRVIELHRMVSEIHAVLAPLLPMVESMASGNGGGNPMLAMMGGMKL